MKILGHQFNSLDERRYAVTTSYNVSFQGTGIYGVAGSTWEPTVNITYNQILKAISDSCISEDATTQTNEQQTNTQQFRNIKSTLHSYLAFAGKTVDSRVGVEMSSAFDETVSSYLREIDVAERTKKDRRSHLKLIQRHIERITADEGAKKRPKQETSLCAELRLAIAKAGVPPKTLARRAGVSPSALQRWLAGAMPNCRGIPTLRRVESELGLARDSLTRLVVEDKAVTGQSSQTIEFRESLRHRCNDKYYLPLSQINSQLMREWKGLFDYKTSVSPGYERSTRGVWRLIPKATCDIDCDLVSKGSAVSPTAEIVLSYIRGYVGFLMRPIERGGWGLSSNESQTLAWLACPEAISSYLEFKTERSGGIRHRGQKLFCITVASLVRQDTGYLWQRTEFAHALPETFRPTPSRTWSDMCSRTYKILLAWKKTSTDMHRAPDEPIASLLSLDEPLLPVLNAIRAIEHDAVAALPGSKRQAILKRDALLLALLISNPLRARTLQSLTVNRANTGSAYRTAQGWRIRLSASQLKNGEGAAGKRYDVAIAPWVSIMLDEYVEEHRPVLSANSPFLFVSSRSDGIWAELSKHVFKLTRRYIPESCGFSTHAFRHLVATTWLKKFPNSFLQVAELLNDRLETVMSAYAHLKRDDSLHQHNEQLLALRTRMK